MKITMPKLPTLLKYPNRGILMTLLIAYPLIATLILLNLPPNGFLYIFLLQIIPIAIVGYHNPQIFKKVLIFSLVFSIPLGLIVEYIAVVTNTWTFINPEAMTLFPNFKLFGVIYFEEFAWYVLLLIYYLQFYEVLLDRHKLFTGKYPKQIKLLEKCVAGAFLIFVSLYFLNPTSLKIPYIYLIMGMSMGLIPLVWVTLKHKKLASKFFFMILYFTYYNGLLEWVGVGGKYWEFNNPDVLIGMLTIFGHSIAFEEFFFWIIIGAPAIAAWYEIFADDSK